MPGGRKPERSSSELPLTRPRAAARWILLIPNLPPAGASLRVKVWRRLQSVGAVGLKSSVYVLPNREDCVETFQWVAREIAAVGGGASLCEGQFFDGTTDDEIERRFIETRNSDYAELAREARVLGKRLQAKRIGEEDLGALEVQAEKMRRRFDRVVAVDFCSATGREAAEGLVRAVERAISSRRSGGPRRSEPLARMEPPKGATWVTRTGVHVDRIASAWLVRRWIDRDAKLKFVSPKGYERLPGELRFDMYDAELTHVGDRCTFEVLLERFGLDEPGLSAIGEIVHDIDLRDGKFGRQETAGVATLIAGICSAHRDDDARIQRGSMVLDDLHAIFALRKGAHTSKGGS